MAPGVKRQQVGVVTLPNRGAVPTYAANWTTHIWVEGAAGGLTQEAVTVAYVDVARPRADQRNIKWVNTATGCKVEKRHLGIESAQEAAALIERGSSKRRSRYLADEYAPVSPSKRRRNSRYGIVNSRKIGPSLLRHNDMWKAVCAARDAAGGGDEGAIAGVLALKGWCGGSGGNNPDLIAKRKTLVEIYAKDLPSVDCDKVCLLAVTLVDVLTPSCCRSGTARCIKLVSCPTRSPRS